MPFRCDHRPQQTTPLVTYAEPHRPSDKEVVRGLASDQANSRTHLRCGGAFSPAYPIWMMATTQIEARQNAATTTPRTPQQTVNRSSRVGHRKAEHRHRREHARLGTQGQTTPYSRTPKPTARGAGAKDGARRSLEFPRKWHLSVQRAEARITLDTPLVPVRRLDAWTARPTTSSGVRRGSPRARVVEYQRSKVPPATADKCQRGSSTTSPVARLYVVLAR